MVFKIGDKCPFCKVGILQIKEGRFGSFLGCDMYHHTGCNFVGKLDPQEMKDPLEQRADEILRQNNKEFLII